MCGMLSCNAPSQNSAEGSLAWEPPREIKSWWDEIYEPRKWKGGFIHICGTYFIYTLKGVTETHEMRRSHIVGEGMWTSNIRGLGILMLSGGW